MLFRGALNGVIYFLFWGGWVGLSLIVLLHGSWCCLALAYAFLLNNFNTCWLTSPDVAPVVSTNISYIIHATRAIVST
jgi:hypothetical protein